MPKEIKVGCDRPSNNEKKEKDNEEIKEVIQEKKEESSMIKVGKPAPDFSASGYHKGKFVNVNLSDYKGKWVLLCFYPGDFTFV